MPRKLRLAYIAHSLRSDWNNGNAHFLRGLLRSMTALGHDVTAIEPETGWSIDNLRSEPLGARSLAEFSKAYADLKLTTYAPDESASVWLDRLRNIDVAILHEWNPPELARKLVHLRDQLGFKLLFHDTHHRASSSPQQMQLFQLDQFDGVLAFGEALKRIYRDRFGLARVWTFHEAADTSIFHPIESTVKRDDVIWVGNWGEGERSTEIREFLLNPVSKLPGTRATIYGVRYPDDALEALRRAHIQHGGYLPNLCTPSVYASARLTVHIPRQQYTSAMAGIPTIRVFEALACGIPLVSAPWQDVEDLFRPGDFSLVNDGAEMTACMQMLLRNPAVAQDQASRGLRTVLSRHTCHHRAQQLTSICEEILS